jgi:hypothetical protein
MYVQVFLGPHYIGRGMVVKFEEGEYWKKVLGPVLVYLNSMPTKGRPGGESAVWEDAKAQAKAEVRKWPYSFPRSTDFTKAEERGALTGRLLLRDRYVIFLAFLFRYRDKRLDALHSRQVYGRGRHAACCNGLCWARLTWAAWILGHREQGRCSNFVSH